MYSLFLMTKMLFAYSVFATYLLQFYVPLDFLEPPLYKRIDLNNRPGIVQTLIQLGFRTFIVLITGKLDDTFLLAVCLTSYDNSIYDLLIGVLMV